MLEAKGSKTLMLKVMCMYAYEYMFDCCVTEEKVLALFIGWEHLTKADGEEGPLKDTHISPYKHPCVAQIGLLKTFQNQTSSVSVGAIKKSSYSGYCFSCF